MINHPRLSTRFSCVPFYRQEDREHSARVSPRGLDGPVMLFQYLARYGQAEPEPGGLGAVEGLEDVGLVFLRDARPVVG